MNGETTTPTNPEDPTFHGPAFPAPTGWVCPKCGAANHMLCEAGEKGGIVKVWVEEVKE